jgi:hypothetical protein
VVVEEVKEWNRTLLRILFAWRVHVTWAWRDIAVGARLGLNINIILAALVVSSPSSLTAWKSIRLHSLEQEAAL